MNTYEYIDEYISSGYGCVKHLNTRLLKMLFLWTWICRKPRWQGGLWPPKVFVIHAYIYIIFYKIYNILYVYIIYYCTSEPPKDAEQFGRTSISVGFYYVLSVWELLMWTPSQFGGIPSQWHAWWEATILILIIAIQPVTWGLFISMRLAQFILPPDDHHYSCYTNYIMMSFTIW